MGIDLFVRRGIRLAAALLLVASASSVTVAWAATAAKGSVRSLGSVARLAPFGGVGIATDSIGDNVDDAAELEFTGRSAAFAGTLEVVPEIDYAEDDVHKVWLMAGEVVSFELDADGTTTDFGLWLFGPTTTDVYQDDPLRWVDPHYYGGPDTYPLSLMSTKIAETGWYYIDVWTWVDGVENGGSGDYALSVDIERAATGLRLDPESALAYGGAASITGSAYSRIEGDQAIEGQVLLSFSTDGHDYYPYLALTTSDGSFTFDLMPDFRSYYYQVTYEGSSSFGSSADNVFVPMSASLTRPTASRYGMRSYTLAGTLAPHHTAGASVVRVYIYRYVSGHWKAYGYRWAKASDSGNATRYSVRYKFPYAGRWRMKAYHSDSGHAPTWTGYTYFTVK